MRFLLAVVFCVFLIPVSGQENPFSRFRMHLKAGGNVPHPVSNQAFRRSFTGIYDLNLNWKINLFSGFSAGIQAKHVLWKTPDNKIPGLNVYGQFNCAGIVVGYDHVISETAVAYANLSVGQSAVHFYGLSYDSIPASFQTQYRIGYGELETGVYFYTEGAWAIGLQTGLVLTNYGFDPYKLALNQHKAYIDEDLDGNVVFINLGISVVYSFLRKKGAAPL